MTILSRPQVITAAVDDSTHEMLQVPFTHSTNQAHHRRESAAIFVIFGLAYGVLGWWLVVHQKVVGFDALDRLSGAYLVWHGVPPKLAAVGFSLPPLQTVVLLPFTIFSKMATSLIALPIVSAIFGGFTGVVFNRLLFRCDVPRLVRYPTVFLLGVTPTIVFYGSGGGSELISLALLGGAMSTLIAWFRTVDTRYLISSGLTFAAATMADYGNIIWLMLAALLVATVLSRHGADDAEVEGSIITYAAPGLYAVSLWCLANWLIVKAPFSWISAGEGTTVNVLHAGSAHVTILNAIVTSLRLALDGAPLILVVAPALIFVAVLQRNELAGWLAAFCVIAIFRPGFEAVVHGNLGAAQMTFSAPMLLMSIAGAGWLYQSFAPYRSMIGAAIVVGMLVTVALVWRGIDVYPYQNLEQAFRHAIEHPSKKPTTSQGGLQVGVTQETQLADYIRDHISTRKSILTDNSQTYAVILLSGKPALFRTRLDEGTGKFTEEVTAPPKQVKYFLVASHDSGDYIANQYAGALQGNRNGLKVIFSDQRYALLSLASGTTLKTSRLQPKAKKTKVNIPQSIVSVTNLP